MIKKRIYILTLSFIFLVSTTGMPFFYHYCEMIGKKSLSECNDCLVEVEEIETSCCAEETPVSSEIFAFQNSSCCIDQFDYKKVEDNFAQLFNSNLANLIVLNLISEAELFDLENGTDFTHYDKYNLPPPKFGKELLNSIHQLKIDIPFC